MWRWIGWAAKLVASAVLLSFLCIWTTGYIVNSYLQTVMKQLEIPIDVQPFALSGVWGTLWGADKPAKEEADNSQEQAEAEVSPPPSETTDVGAVSEGTADPEPSDGAVLEEESSASPDDSPASATPNQEPAEEAGTNGGTDEGTNTKTPGIGEAIPVWSNGTSSIGNGSNGNNGSNSSNSSNNLGTALSAEDRQRLLSLVVSKLDSEQLQQLSSYLEGGIDDEELPGLQALLKNTLNEQEYEQMMAILQGQSTDTQP